jgi:DNA-binding protein YbaB
MIGDLFGNIGAQQEQLKAKLDSIEFSESSQDGAITITATASKRILDISIHPEKLNPDDIEQLEDLLLITLNKVLDKAEEMASEQTQKLIQDMLPPGFGNMFG